MFADSGCITIAAFISPYRADRDIARELHEKTSLAFIEVFVDAPLSVVEQRDPKGLYRKARAGEIKSEPILSEQACHSRSSDFTGISAPYEDPEKPEIHIKTDQCDVTRAVEIIANYLVEHNYISSHHGEGSNGYEGKCESSAPKVEG